MNNSLFKQMRLFHDSKIYDQYRLMSLFHQSIIGEKVQRKMATLRHKLFAMGGYMVKDGNRRILKLSLAMKRREWFLGL